MDADPRRLLGEEPQRLVERGSCGQSVRRSASVIEPTTPASAPWLSSCRSIRCAMTISPPASASTSNSTRSTPAVTAARNPASVFSGASAVALYGRSRAADHPGVRARSRHRPRRVVLFEAPALGRVRDDHPVRDEPLDGRMVVRPRISGGGKGGRRVRAGRATARDRQARTRAGARSSRTQWAP